MSVIWTFKQYLYIPLLIKINFLNAVFMYGSWLFNILVAMVT